MGIDQPGRHHDLQDRYRPQPDWDHDAQRQIERHQRIAPEPVFRERKRRHGAKQQHAEQRRHRHDQRVLEIEQEIALVRHRLEPDQGKALRVGQGQRIGKDRPPVLEGVDDHNEHRKQRNQRIADQHRMGGKGAGQGGTGRIHQNWYLLSRVWMPNR